MPLAPETDCKMRFATVVHSLPIPTTKSRIMNQQGDAPFLMKHMLHWESLQRTNQVDTLVTIATPRNMHAPIKINGLAIMHSAESKIVEISSQHDSLLNRVQQQKQTCNAVCDLYNLARRRETTDFDVALSPHESGWRYLVPNSW